MKRLFALLAFFLLASCQEASIEETATTAVDYKFYAYMPGVDGRTYVDDQFGLHWTNDDRVTIFHGIVDPLQFAFTGDTGAKSGTFRNVDGIFYAPDPDAPGNVAVYPYSDNHVLNESTRAVALTMPAEQTYVENSFGLGANTMIAITSGVNDLALYFKNVGSYLNVRLWGENQSVKSITVTATGGEALSGAAVVTPVYEGDPICEMSAENSSPSVTLVCEEAVTINTDQENPVSFWLVVPPVTLADGLSVTVENTEGSTQTYVVEKSVTFERNVYNTLTRELDYTAAAIEAAKQIVYTSTDGQVVAPNNDSAFNAAIVSNTYKNGKGVIVFDEVVTTIGSQAFAGCSTLEDITLPEGVTEIGNEAFKDCSNLNLFKGKHATSDGRCLIVNGELKAFAPDGVNSYVIPEGVTTIGLAAFWNSNELESVELPSTLTSIKGNAFGKCTNLVTVTIPNSVSEIIDNPFRGCSALSKFVGKFASDNGRCLIIDNTLVSFAPAALTEYDIPEGVTTIGYMSFGYANQLTRVTIPESVTVIAGDAFYKCASLTDVTIPANVTRIDYGSFQECVNLTAIYCEPITPPAGSYMMFYDNAEGRLIYVPAKSLADYKAAEGWSSYADAIVAAQNPNKPANNEIWYTTNTGNGIYTSFNMFESKYVSNIYDEERECWVLTFAGDITYVGAEAFTYRSDLTSVVLPESVTSIKNNAFSGCSALVSVEFPSQLREIANFVFASCTALVDVVIPDSVVTIGSGAFDSCTGLKRVVVGNGVTTIGTYAFYGSQALQSVEFGDNLEQIDNSAFYNSGITSITLPASLKTLGNDVFGSCKSLKEVYCQPILPPTSGSRVFSNNSSNLIIYVPSNSLNNYKNASEWNLWAQYMRGY